MTALNSTPDQPIPKELFVISDRACKTMTYLLAMTYNFPAVSFQWVLHSAAMREQKNFRHYMLPVGYRYSPYRIFETILHTMHDIDFMYQMNMHSTIRIMPGLDCDNCCQRNRNKLYLTYVPSQQHVDHVGRGIPGADLPSVQRPHLALQGQDPRGHREASFPQLGTRLLTVPIGY